MFALPICTNQPSIKDYAVLSALLPLHSGDDCSETQIRGIQQLAALEYGLNKVNADLSEYGDLKISKYNYLICLLLICFFKYFNC